jgi:hypothetical protein
VRIRRDTRQLHWACVNNTKFIAHAWITIVHVWITIVNEENV